MTINKKKIGFHLLAEMPRRHSARVCLAVVIIAKGLCFCILATSFTLCQAIAADNAAEVSSLSLSLSALEGAATSDTLETQPVMSLPYKRANFEREGVSHEARMVADWVVDSGDNHSLPFAIVDKKDAKVFVFDAGGHLHGAAPALLGLALGDDPVPGIGDRALASIRPEERTTPAGRFVAALDRNLRGKEILWVDYDGAISMHPVLTTKPEERRLARLATPTPLDNRISYGCINVPAKFFESVVRPAFTGTDGVVYVLPETRMVHEVFALYALEEQARLQTASQPVPVHRSPSSQPIGIESYDLYDRGTFGF